ncbi:Acetyl-coenzyme A synthetase [Smittium culicis]|uniref:Acetyl-coenzyme A synthetase n=1 Tax=Smittium culicis TaxID=133412 RepID=A0A1R1YPD5_9FUNG|nr:Acetyl-coenzyme A synthetase [Smittium culicis]OMJ28695.1 Acetyl-coenzyme A synthetase [Smittium culicis]
MLGNPSPQDPTTALYPPKLNARYPAGRTPAISSFEQYKTMYDQSLNDPDTFFAERASELIEFSKPYEKVHSGSLSEGNVEWFVGGELNISYNCVDRWAEKTPDNVAISFEADQPGNRTTVTFKELLEKVCRLAGVLQSFGLKKGDGVAIYMPMVPEAAVAMLACTRLGLVHTVVFAGFSAHSLSERIRDSNSSVVITADQGLRGGKVIQTKSIVDEALETCPAVKNVVVFERTGSKDVSFTPGRDVHWAEAAAAQSAYIPPVAVGSEDPSFVLHTSGSTGKPKGMVHTTAGYLLGAAMTSKYTFDLAIGDVFCCSADIGWITGHTYGVYGPLSLGVTSVIFESLPSYPDGARFWKTVDEHKITQFYTAPTAIRALRRLGDEFPKSCDLSSLRVIASVGEPINPEAWVWYSEMVGRNMCPVVDTYWQTENGSHLITPLPFATTNKPGSASFPMFGIEPVILDPNTGEELKGGNVTGVLSIKRAWPSIARTILGDHERYMTSYMNAYKGTYFTGDGASRDADGYYWIRGRVDDVINVSGHRMSTAEIESAIILNHNVAESAVVGIEDEISGQSICAFVSLNKGIEESPEVIKSIITSVRKEIGPIATPKNLIIVQDLPKTRSGKIIRRVLRKVASNEADQLGDTSTMADPAVLESLIKKTNAVLGI